MNRWINKVLFFFKVAKYNITNIDLHYLMLIMWMSSMLFLANRRERVCVRENTPSYEMWSDGCLWLIYFSILYDAANCHACYLVFFWSFVVPILTQTQGAAEPFFSLSSFFMLSHSFLSLIFMTILVIIVVSLTVYIFAPCSDWWWCTSNIYCELCKYIKWMHSKYISNHLSITVWFLFFFFVDNRTIFVFFCICQIRK